MSIHAIKSDMERRGAPLLAIDTIVVVDSVIVLLWLDVALRSLSPPPPPPPAPLLLPPRMIGDDLNDVIAFKEGVARYMVVHENAKAANSSAVNSLSPRE